MNDIKQYVTLCGHSEERVAYFNELKEQIPSLQKFHALEGQFDLKEIDKLFDYFQIPVAPWMYISHGGGKISRWATVIMVMKYIYDLELEDRIIILEDDLWLDKNFNFMADQWPTDSCLVKLSMWGEMMACGIKGAENFLKSIYEIGIDKNNDMWIYDNNLYCDRILIEKDASNKGLFKLLNPTSDGLIKRVGINFDKPKCFDKTWILNPESFPNPHGNKLQGTIKLPANSDKIFTKKIFFKESDVDFKKVLSRL